MDIFLPTGDYDQKHLANPGRNYWTFEPLFGVTFLPGAGFDISAKVMYDLNTTNNDTKYKSGQELHLDYAVGKKMGDFTAGLAGYFYKQLTSDELNGADVGNRGQVLGLGPALKYDYKNMSLSLKYIREGQTRNRPDGDNFWFKFIYAF